MNTFIKVFVILALSVTVSLGLYVLVDSQFSMNFAAGGPSPAFAWLMKMRADENGGQIAPPLDEIQSSGNLPPFMQGALGSAPDGVGTGPQPVALAKGFEPSKAGERAIKDLARLSVAAVVAVLMEIALMWGLTRRRHRIA